MLNSFPNKNFRLFQTERVCRQQFQIWRNDEILDSSKLKEFADNNFKFDGNGRKFSKRVGNTEGKGEIARYEQFLLFPVFSKDLYCRHVKSKIVWERVNCGSLCSVWSEPFIRQSRLLMTLKKDAFENIVGNGEIAGNQHFLHFLWCFQAFPEQILNFW